MVVIEIVLIVSILLQIISALLALRLIKITGFFWGWMALAIAVSLMAVRRSVSFYSMIIENEPATMLSTELIALAISILMFIGILNIRPVLRYLYSQKADLEKLTNQLKQEIEQRKKAQQKISISEEKFRKLTEYSPVYIWKSDENAMCDYFNEQWLSFRGKTLDQEKNMGWTKGLHPDDKIPVINKYMNAFKKRNEFELEYRIKNKNNEYRWFYDIGAPMYDDNSKFIGYIGSCIDITARRNMETALKANERKFQKVVNNLPLYIAYVDSKLRYQFANRAYRKEFNLKHHEIKGKDKKDLIGTQAYEKLKPYIEKVLKGQKVHYREKLVVKGKQYFVEGSLLPDFDNKGQVIGYYGVHNDITQLIQIQNQLEQSRNQLRKLTTYQQELIERERAYIAGEIHDELGQYLSVMHMGLSWAKKQMTTTDRKLKSKIIELLELTNTTLQKVKKLATDLHPSIIDDMGICSAIEWYVNEFSKNSNIECDITLPPHEINIDKSKALNIYRIVQEALNNVYRHAEASKVEVVMKQHKKDITLEITDDGVGYEPNENQATDNLGLIGMKERAYILNAAFSITSDKGSGTQISMKIPIN
ncbi:MAG: PAS domain-containing sensor histidine kinase [Bacteroidia bacterium]